MRITENRLFRIKNELLSVAMLFVIVLRFAFVVLILVHFFPIKLLVSRPCPEDFRHLELLFVLIAEFFVEDHPVLSYGEENLAENMRKFD